MDAYLHLELLLRHGAEPVEGWLARDDRPAVAFTGYLELLAAVERAAAGTAVEPRATAEGS